jgi:hypothetical protein
MGGVFTTKRSAQEAFDWKDDEGREIPTPIFVADGENGQKKRVFTPADRRVEIGLNVIALHEVDDADHFFECNLLLHIWWNCRPMKYLIGDKRPHPFPPAFVPWMQFHNLKNLVNEIDNAGMAQPTREELNAKAEEFYANPKNADKACMAFAQRNFIGQFLNGLDLHAFPFDTQRLNITIISNTTSETTFTHKVQRQSKPQAIDAKLPDGLKWYDENNPGLPDPKDHVKVVKWLEPAPGTKPRIKCNLEGDTVSEWTILLQPKEGIATANNSDPAVAVYSFKEHDPAFSAENAIYQRMDLYVVAMREVINFLWTVVVPTTLLSASSLSVFSMDINSNGGIGNRLTILFTIILAVIANTISSQGRLPRVDYLTWADIVLNAMQYFLYLMVIQTSICISLATAINMAPEDLDNICFWVLLGIFAVLEIVVVVSGVRLHHERALTAAMEILNSRKCFWQEEDRLFEVETGVRRRTDPFTPKTRTYDSTASRWGKNKKVENEDAGVGHEENGEVVVDVKFDH